MTLIDMGRDGMGRAGLVQNSGTHLFIIDALPLFTDCDMPVYRLQYFDFRARAEVPRLLFAYAGQEFEDVRVPYKTDEWYMNIKPSMQTKTS